MAKIVTNRFGGNSTITISGDVAATEIVTLADLKATNEVGTVTKSSILGIIWSLRSTDSTIKILRGTDTVFAGKDSGSLMFARDLQAPLTLNNDQDYEIQLTGAAVVVLKVTKEIT